MGRFKQFIESNNEKEKKNNKKGNTGNVFKRNCRKKRIYKPRCNKEEFLNKMKSKGATIQSYSIFDAVQKKENKSEKRSEKRAERKNKKDIKKMELNKIYSNIEEDMSEYDNDKMKDYVLSRYYEEQVEEEEIELNNQIISNGVNTSDDIISF